MTERLYYRDSFLYEFDAEVVDTVCTSDSDPRTAIILDRTAFYPTSGGQVFDTGEILLTETNSRLRIAEVSERDDGNYPPHSARLYSGPQSNPRPWPD